MANGIISLGIGTGTADIGLFITLGLESSTITDALAIIRLRGQSAPISLLGASSPVALRGQSSPIQLRGRE
jgi:hypothetical protein